VLHVLHVLHCVVSWLTYAPMFRLCRGGDCGNFHHSIPKEGGEWFYFSRIKMHWRCEAPPQTHKHTQMPLATPRQEPHPHTRFWLAGSFVPPPFSFAFFPAFFWHKDSIWQGRTRKKREVGRKNLRVARCRECCCWWDMTDLYL